MSYNEDAMMQAGEDMFYQMANGSGRVNMAAFLRYQRESAQDEDVRFTREHENHCRDQFRNMDLNNNGYLSFDEFMQGFQMMVTMDMNEDTADDNFVGGIILRGYEDMTDDPNWRPGRRELAEIERINTKKMKLYADMCSTSDDPHPISYTLSEMTELEKQFRTVFFDMRRHRPAQRVCNIDFDSKTMNVSSIRSYVNDCIGEPHPDMTTPQRKCFDFLVNQVRHARMNHDWLEEDGENRSHLFEIQVDKKSRTDWDLAISVFALKKNSDSTVTICHGFYEEQWLDLDENIHNWSPSQLSGYLTFQLLCQMPGRLMQLKH